MYKILQILILILIPFIGYTQATYQNDSWQGLTYELGLGTTLSNADYYDFNESGNDSLFMTGDDYTLNFYFNIEASLKFGSLYFGTGLIADNDKYTNLTLYNIPLRVGLRIYPIPEFLYVYGNANVFWGDRVAGADLFDNPTKRGCGVGYGVGVGVILFDFLSVTAGYSKQQYRIIPNYVLKDVNGLELKVSIRMNYY